MRNFTFYRTERGTINILSSPQVYHNTDNNARIPNPLSILQTRKITEDPTYTLNIIQKDKTIT